MASVEITDDSGRVIRPILKPSGEICSV